MPLRRTRHAVIAFLGACLVLGSCSLVPVAPARASLDLSALARAMGYADQGGIHSIDLSVDDAAGRRIFSQSFEAFSGASPAQRSAVELELGKPYRLTIATTCDDTGGLGSFSLVNSQEIILDAQADTELSIDIFSLYDWSDESAWLPTVDDAFGLNNLAMQPSMDEAIAIANAAGSAAGAQDLSYTPNVRASWRHDGGELIITLTRGADYLLGGAVHLAAGSVYEAPANPGMADVVHRISLKGGQIKTIEAVFRENVPQKFLVNGFDLMEYLNQAGFPWSAAS